MKTALCFIIIFLFSYRSPDFLNVFVLKINNTRYLFTIEGKLSSNILTKKIQLTNDTINFGSALCALYPHVSKVYLISKKDKYVSFPVEKEIENSVHYSPIVLGKPKKGKAATYKLVIVRKLDKEGLTDSTHIATFQLKFL
ncbi:MAG: hypothetical protein ACHQF2_08550 [Flavobacteriales bacterium]